MIEKHTDPSPAPLKSDRIEIPALRQLIILSSLAEMKKVTVNQALVEPAM
jgi:hypothetical protein